MFSVLHVYLTVSYLLDRRSVQWSLWYCGEIHSHCNSYLHTAPGNSVDNRRNSCISICISSAAKSYKILHDGKCSLLTNCRTSEMWSFAKTWAALQIHDWSPKSRLSRLSTNHRRRWCDRSWIAMQPCTTETSVFLDLYDGYITGISIVSTYLALFSFTVPYSPV